MHRHALWLTVIAAIGCKGKTETVAATTGSGSAVAKTGSGSGSGSMGIGPCFPTGNDGILESFTADDKAATFCVKLVDQSGADKPATEKCMAVDLASGAYSETTAPPKPAPLTTTYKQDPDAVQACTAGKCVTLELPQLPKAQSEESPPTYSIQASADGTKLLASGNEMKRVVMLDAATGKKTKAISIPDKDECLVDAHYVGDTIYMLTSNCAGPGGSGYLFSGDGKLLANMEAEDVNVYGTPPIHVDGDQWAFADYNGGTYMIWDVKAAKHVRTVRIERLEDCEACTMLQGEAIHATPLARTAGGKLVAISGYGVTVTDAKTGKVEPTRRMPMCSPAKPTP